MRRLVYLSILLLTSCATPKNMVYFADADILAKQQISQKYELRIQNDDLLYVSVTSSNPELANLFNSQSLNTNTASTPTAIEYSSYLVDSNGDIVLPILGKLNVRGLTLNEVALKIEKLIIDGQYIKDPTVTVKLVNFKVSVLGEVKAPGVKQISSERVTIFDALGLAGDLTIYGKRENVSIIREINGVREVGVVDLSKKDIFSSDYYYLQPNDVVYVQPNKKQQRNSVWDPFILSSTLSGASVLLSIISLLVK